MGYVITAKGKKALESMKQFLLAKDFKAETLALLNHENLIKLAVEQGYKG